MMTSIVEKVDFYSGLAPGNVFSWHTMNGGPAKFAWLVLDVCQPFASLKDYEIPNNLRGYRNSPIVIEEIQQIKLFRTMRTPAPNPLTNPEYIHDSAYQPGGFSSFKDIIDLSARLEEQYRESEEILWLVKKPSMMRFGPERISDVMEVALISNVLENRIWEALGYVGINRLQARRKYHIGVKERSYLNRGQLDENGLCCWIRYVHHESIQGSHWSRSDMEKHFPFWGCGVQTNIPIGFRLDTSDMTGTCEINKVWRW